MFPRLIHLMILIMASLSLVLAGCSPTAELQSATPAANEAAAGSTATLVIPAPTLGPTATPLPAVPPAEASAAADQSAAIAPPIEPAEAITAETTEPASAAEPGQVVRVFRIVPDQSEAAYEVTEEFLNRPVRFFAPVGRTQTIEGEFQLGITGNQVQLEDNQFTVDLRTLTSDDSRRDQRIRDNWLESNKYPLAQFIATSIENLPEDVAEGQAVPFKLTGDMTIRDVTRSQTFDVIAKLEGNTFTGTATTNLLMKDYGFDPPEILGILKVTDGVTVTVNFVAEEVGGAS